MISRIFANFVNQLFFASNNFCTNQDLDTWLAPQNDRLNLIFVKDEHTIGKKMARYGRKWLLHTESVLFQIRVQIQTRYVEIVHDFGPK